MATEKHKIARLVLTQSFYDSEGEWKQKEIDKAFDSFIKQNYGKKYFEFLVMSGGVIRVDYLDATYDKFSIAVLENKYTEYFFDWGNEVLAYFFSSILKKSSPKLKDIANYLTIGLDFFKPNSKEHIELVAVYDLKTDETIHWTGKFYPTEVQKRNLIKINDLSSHFIKLNNQNIAILGCHDLMVYSPRGQAMVTSDSWKGKVSSSFKQKCAKFKPEIVLQHPHSTDTPNIWNLAWKTLEKELPSVEHYASGISYPKAYDPRGTLDKVLEKTKKGDVLDFILM